MCRRSLLTHTPEFPGFRGRYEPALSVESCRWPYASGRDFESDMGGSARRQRLSGGFSGILSCSLARAPHRPALSCLIRHGSRRRCILMAVIPSSSLDGARRSRQGFLVHYYLCDGVRVTKSRDSPRTQFPPRVPPGLDLPQTYSQVHPVLSCSLQCIHGAKVDPATTLSFVFWCWVHWTSPVFGTVSPGL
jgi:hypothetical protein